MKPANRVYAMRPAHGRLGARAAPLSPNGDRKVMLTLAATIVARSDLPGNGPMITRIALSLLIAALIGSGAARADSPSTPSGQDVVRPSIVLPALPASEITGTFADPKGRFTLSHDADWRIMLNWGGGPELFCQWQPCRGSVLSGCFVTLLPWDHGEMDSALLFALSGMTTEEIDLGVLGTVKRKDGGSLKSIAGRSWVSGVQGISLFNKVEMESRTWASVGGGQMVLMQCNVTRAVAPTIEAKVERLLAGFAVTKR
jgi:hypothetical protein